MVSPSEAEKYGPSTAGLRDRGRLARGPAGFGWALGLAAAVALSAAGCGSDGADHSPGGTTVVPGTTTVQQALDEATTAGDVCVPDCEGRTCGPDGCLGQCGVCAAGTACSDGQCVAWSCTPACEGRECGDDGCGGSCGTCSGDTFCLPATGTCNVADPCDGITFEGCCQGTTLRWCQAGALEELDCATDGCGWADTEYNCGGSGEDPSGAFLLNCDGTPAPPADTGGACGEITFDGCCDGAVLTWCEGGALETIDCSDNATCGWSEADGFYNCGTDGLEDPSGVLPLACNLDSGGGDPDPPVGGCGDVTDVGCCDGATLTWCEVGELMTLACESAETCGWSQVDGYYDCGTDGAAEPGGDWPKTCGDAGGGDPDPPVGGCGDVTDVGCCDGATLTWCEVGELMTLACESAETCGWSQVDGYYDCGTDGAAEPGGDWPKTCAGDEPSCTADCGAAQCGDDGCGGSCGTCGAGAECDASSGMCVSACTPACNGKQCGDDGCGGTCGTCASGKACNAETGKCSVACAADCAGKQCGDDGCGGSCGTCDGADVCSAAGRTDPRGVLRRADRALV